MVLLFSLVLTGCGGGDSDFVATTSGGAPAPAPPSGTTGNLTFSFTKIQAAVAPSAAVALQFEFYDSGGRSIFSFDSVFATTVTVREVPVEAVRAEITAYAPGGVPLGVLTVPVTVTPDATVNVDLSPLSFVPATLEELEVTPSSIDLQLPTNSTVTLSLRGVFSTGDEVRFGPQTGGEGTFVSRDASVARADSTGQVTGLKAGATFVDVSYSVQGMSARTAVPVLVSGEAPPVVPARLVLNPATVDLSPGSSMSITATYFPADSAVGTDVTQSTSGLGTSGLTYDRGLVAVGAGVAVPSTGEVTVSYGTEAGTVSAVLRVTVSPPLPAIPLGYLELEPRTLTFSSGGPKDPGGIGVFRAYFTPPSGGQRLDVTESVSVDWSGFSNPVVNAGSFGYLYRTVPVFGLNEKTGTVFTTGVAPPNPGDTAIMQVTYVNAGQTYRDSARVTIGTPEVRSVDFVIAPGGTLRLPVRTRDFPMLAFLNYTNGLRQSLPSCGCPDPFGFFYMFELEAPNTTNARLDDGSVNGVQVLDTRGQAGTVRVAVYQFAPFGPPMGVRLGSFDIQVLDNITTVDVALDPATIEVNQRAPYSVTATYSDGTVQDMTAAWDVAISAADRDFIRAASEPSGNVRVHRGFVRGRQLTMGPVTLRANGFNRQLFTFGNGVSRGFTNQEASVTVTAVDPSFP